jgi:hypothetical protein
VDILEGGMLEMLIGSMISTKQSKNLTAPAVK